jgi:hypothetical protein
METIKTENMRTINILNTDLEIYSANAIHAGYGHKKITVELYYNSNYREFIATTSNMPCFDEANELEGEDKEIALFNIIENQIEEQVNEWLIEENY